MNPTELVKTKPAQQEKKSLESPVPNMYFEQEEPLTKEEQEVDSLMALMSEIKQMQEKHQGKDGPKVSDQERRKNAEEMINKLSKMMDIGVDEDYDSQEADP